MATSEDGRRRRVDHDRSGWRGRKKKEMRITGGTYVSVAYPTHTEMKGKTDIVSLDQLPFDVK